MEHIDQEWMSECKALVRHPSVWDLLDEWDWLEAYDTGFTPTRAVHCALLDVLAPKVGEFFGTFGGPR